MEANVRYREAWTAASAESPDPSIRVPAFPTDRLSTLLAHRLVVMRRRRKPPSERESEEAIEQLHQLEREVEQHRRQIEAVSDPLEPTDEPNQEHSPTAPRRARNLL
jgi:hypothetical protein